LSRLVYERAGFRRQTSRSRSRRSPISGDPEFKAFSARGQELMAGGGENPYFVCTISRYGTPP
jgi:hypothetical protein